MAVASVIAYPKPMATGVNAASASHPLQALVAAGYSYADGLLTLICVRERLIRSRPIATLSARSGTVGSKESVTVVIPQNGQGGW